MALDEELISLRYYAQQHTSRQWVHLMAAMFAEFQERVDPVEADQFLETMGSRMARSLPLRHCDNLEELDLSGTAVTDRGLQVLRDCLELSSIALNRIVNPG